MKKRGKEIIPKKAKYVQGAIKKSNIVIVILR